MYQEVSKTLTQLIMASSNVFIIGHNDPDFDSIASCIGLGLLVNSLNKKANIIINKNELDPAITNIVNSYTNNLNIEFISKEKCLENTNDNSLLIMTDVNNDYMISLNNNLSNFKNIFILDHHKEDSHTIKTLYKYIDVFASSASEIITNILNLNNVTIDKNTSTYLLAGILLDTDNLSRNCSNVTKLTIQYLNNIGASINDAENLFITDYESDKKVKDLVLYNTNIISFSKKSKNDLKIGYVLNRRNPTLLYKKVEIAKAADYLLNYNMDVSFALGYIKNNLISISARSLCDIDVADILSSIENVQGGGNPTSAGAKSYNENIFNLEEKLIKQIGNYLVKEEDPSNYKLKILKKS